MYFCLRSLWDYFFTVSLKNPNRDSFLSEHYALSSVHLILISLPPYLILPNKVKHCFFGILKSFKNVEDVCRRSKFDQETVDKQIMSCG